MKSVFSVFGERKLLLGPAKFIYRVMHTCMRIEIKIKLKTTDMLDAKEIFFPAFETTQINHSSLDLVRIASSIDRVKH